MALGISRLLVHVENEVDDDVRFHVAEDERLVQHAVFENVRQLRGTVDDYCPKAVDGVHTYDYGPRKCRQVKDVEITMNLGWAMPPTGSAMILRK